MARMSQYCWRRPGGRLSLRQSFETFVDWMTNHPVPWDQEQPETVGADTLSEQLKLAEATYARLTAGQQDATRRLFTRLVHLARPGEGGEDTSQRVKFKELSPAEQAVAEEWSTMRLVRIQQAASEDERTVEPASESLIREWKRLRGWLDADREFLLWRQSLRADIFNRVLLTGPPVAEAKRRLEEHPDDLNDLEKLFISMSVRQSQRIRRARLAIIAGVLLLLMTAVYYFWRKRPVTNKPATAESLQLSGEASVYAGDCDSAIKFFDQAIELNPNLAQAYYSRGVCYEKKKDADSAIRDYSKAIQLNPNDAQSHFQRGQVYEFLGYNVSSAIGDYGEAIKLKPDWLAAYFARARAEIQEVVNGASRNPQDALDDLNQVLDLQPGQPDALRMRSDLYAFIDRTYFKGTPTRSQAISGLFDNDGTNRVRAYGTLMEDYATNAVLIPELLSFARKHLDNQNGIYNTLVVLSHLDQKQTKPHADEIRAFAQEVKGMGPKISARVDKLLYRLGA